MRQGFVLSGLVIALAACQPAAPPDIDMPTVEPDPAEWVSCGADRLQGLVGQNRSVLDGMTLPDPVRIVGWDMAVTLDFNPERLNIGYDRADIITEVSCG